MKPKFSKEAKPETRINQSRWLDLSVGCLVFHKNSHHVEVLDTDKIELGVILSVWKQSFSMDFGLRYG